MLTKRDQEIINTITGIIGKGSSQKAECIDFGFRIADLEVHRIQESRLQIGIANCETGNPPEGWESEGQFRIWLNHQVFMAFFLRLAVLPMLVKMASSSPDSDSSQKRL